jgi:amino acid transporter
MAVYNTAARYLFSLARERLAPAALGRTHRTRHSPHIASMAVTGLVAVYIVAFTLYDPSTEASLLKLGTWSPLLGVLGILGVQAIASLAIVRYFRTAARDGFHWWRTFLAPVIGGVAQVGACYLLIANRGALAGAADAWFVQAIPWMILAVFLGGMGIALWMKGAARERFAGIGSFEHDDRAVTEPAVAGASHVPVGA